MHCNAMQCVSYWTPMMSVVPLTVRIKTWFSQTTRLAYYKFKQEVFIKKTARQLAESGTIGSNNSVKYTMADRLTRKPSSFGAYQKAQTLIIVGNEI